MEKFKMFILALGMFFSGFLILIGSTAGLIQMMFMAAIYLSRKHFRFAMRRITENNFFLVAVFGTFLGLIEEVLWFWSEPGIEKIMFDSLYSDLASTLPAYFIFYLVVYALAKRQKITEKRAFLSGGIFGYCFYFIAESGIFGFQFGGIPGAPIWLVSVWEINNFFLNGLLVWFPLYLSDFYSSRN